MTVHPDGCWQLARVSGLVSIRHPGVAEGHLPLTGKKTSLSFQMGPIVEDVTEETLDLAADRVVVAARTAAALASGSDPELRPGPHCRWCPRSVGCPAVPAGRAPAAERAEAPS